MKKILHIITTLFTVVCFSQAITVNTSTYTVPQLVTDILVNKPCVPVSNITWRTGTNFGSTNGIGYFNNTNPAFPLTSGVLLTTGNVLNSPGPNSTQLNDGNAAWTGDAALEATLLAAGITMNSTNATVLEFDFVPFSSNFNFQFLFASEEYGNFQCQFSDAFAFLLTNTSTGITSNLAVVPSTTTPISVVTIRDFLYNSSCPSVNPSYFGAFNGGSAAAGSATNFNGQTVVMNATSSTLVPNITYHIKLVIADRQDSQADSAIFLGANSFNVGQDVLGADLTVANNTAICINSTHTITSGLNPLVYSFAWTFNGNPIGGNTPNLTVNQPGVYGLTYTIIATGCVVTNDFITIEYYNSIITPNPLDLFKCNSGQPNYTFDLSFNTPIVNVLGTQISYHANLADATTNSNPLPNNYNVATGSLPATIWIRILDISTGCVSTKTFQLNLTPPPVANNPGNITLCETVLGSNTANFNLASQTNTVLGGQLSTIYGVSYYTNAADANAGTNPIDTSIPFVSGNTTIFVRIQNSTEPACFNITSFNLIVIPKPILDGIPNQYVCVSYTLPVLVNPGNYYTGPNQGLPMLNAGDIISTDSTIYIYYTTPGSPSCPSERSFRVEIVTLTDITPTDVTACDRYLLPALDYNVRYFTAPGGPTGGGTELFGGTTLITTPGINTVYLYFVSTDVPPCSIQSQFIITINVTPTITGLFPNVFDCTSYALPPLAVGNYYTFDAGTGLYTLAVSPIITTTTLYVFATSNNCRTPDIIFTVYINTLGIANVTQCLSYTLPALPIGEYRDAPNGGGNIIPAGTVITSTTNIYTYVPGIGIPNCTDDDFFTITIQGPFLTTPTDITACATYLLPVQPDGADYYTLAGGPATLGNVQLIPNIDSITTTTTIFVYKPSLIVGCFNEKPWLITINQRPVIDSRANVEQCTSYILSPLTNGNYFDDPNGVNPLSAGDTITVNNTIYIYAANPNDPTCFSQNSFDIAINGVEADPIPTQLTYCNSFTFPVLPTANNFYYTLPGGPLGGGSIIPFGTTVTSATVLPTYYIYYETGDRLNCSDENPFSITINNTPILTPPVQNTVRVCESYTLQPLTTGKYYTLPGGPLVIGNIEIIAPITYNLLNPAPTTIYAYAETSTTPNCSIEQPINITIFNVVEPANVTNCSSFLLPNLPSGQNYYSASNGGGLLSSNLITTTQNIYIFGFSGFTPNCSDEFMFTVTIIPTPIANPATITAVCDNFGANDGIYQFDLTQVQAQVLGAQTPITDFNFAYFTSLADANAGTNAIAAPTTYQNDNPFSDSIWVRITNNTLTSPCFATVEIRLIINPLPEPYLLPEYFICSDYKTGTILNTTTLDTGLSSVNYSFVWTHDGAPYGGNTSSVTTNQIGNYTVIATNTLTTCVSKPVTTTVTLYTPYIEVVPSNAFEDPTYITVNILGTGSGNYEYQIDHGIYQSSNVFYNVTPGVHDINVRDKNGYCDPAPTTAEIVNYPKFFTPNGDGFHETWNIIHMKTTNPNAPINIYDRFGKLIKQITPTSDGWNGNYNGKPLPATDYWFTVDYNEKGTSKVFKSHFSLKR